MKYPTPKQVRFHFHKLASLRYRLMGALNDAHEAGVIVYDHKEYYENSPCKTLFETWDRVLATTEKQLAKAMRDEIMKRF